MNDGDDGSTDHALGWPEEDVESGEKHLRSPLTGKLYRVTKWIDKGDGEYIAIQKEEVDDD